MMYLIKMFVNRVETRLRGTVKERVLKYSNKREATAAAGRVSVYKLQKLY